MIVTVFHHDFPARPDDLTLVARVNAWTAETPEAALEYAWRRTQNIDGSWSRGARLPSGMNGDFSADVEVVASLPVIDGTTYGLRSSMVGDVFEIDGDRYRVANLGFEKIDPEPYAPDEDAALKAAWDQAQ